MSLDEELGEIYRKVEKESRKNILEDYKNYFLRLRDKAVSFMKLVEIDKIEFGVLGEGVVFRADGKFYDSSDREICYENIPSFFQRSSDETAVKNHERNYRTPSYHNSMIGFLKSFKECVKDRLVGSL